MSDENQLKKWLTSLKHFSDRWTCESNSVVCFIQILRKISPCSNYRFFIGRFITYQVSISPSFRFRRILTFLKIFATFHRSHKYNASCQVIRGLMLLLRKFSVDRKYFFIQCRWHLLSEAFLINKHLYLRFTKLDKIQRKILLCWKSNNSM